ncbi:MAG: YfhO family protein, partial [Candidatus Aureabacteria bacterium]|nr:YfhO family protein [Candidatus Auribacterota bacterium]
RIMDLFSVKYIVSKGELRVPCETVFEDIYETNVSKGKPASLGVRPVSTREIVMRSFLEGAQHARQGEVVALITLRDGAEKVASFPVMAGIHTAEVFLLNDPSKKEAVQHAQCEMWDNWEEGDWYGNVLKGTNYRGIFKLDSLTHFDRIEVNYLYPHGSLVMTRILIRPERHEDMRQQMSSRFKRVFEDNQHGIIIYENKDVLPRAFLANRVEVAASTEAALDRLLDKSFSMTKCVILEEPPPDVFHSSGDAAVKAGGVEIVKYTPNRIEMKATATEDCFLFLSDVYYPGWETLVDGKKKKTYIADYAFRAAYLPAGEHTVVMRFRPKSIMIGGAVSLLALMTLAVGFIRECRKTSRSGSDIR